MICPQTEEEADRFFQGRGILPEIITCDKNNEMGLFIGDEIQWHCNLSSCRRKRNIFKGSWLSPKNLLGEICANNGNTNNGMLNNG